MGDAPKDGSDILAFSPNEGWSIAFYRSGPFEESGWFVSMGDDEPIEDPVIWMPMPKMPPPTCVDVNKMPCWETECGEVHLTFDEQNWTRLGKQEQERLYNCALNGEWAWQPYNR